MISFLLICLLFACLPVRDPRPKRTGHIVAVQYVDARESVTD